MASQFTQHSGLILEKVSHSFGKKRAVNNVSLQVFPGEVVCLLGPSGCGKTTLLRVSAGIERVQTGRIFVSGREVASPDNEVFPENRSVGLMFQDYALFPHLSVFQNVGFGLNKLKKRDRNLRVKNLLDDVDLGHCANAYPHSLSGGEQQRVALMRVLAPEPSVILLDEPFSGLDIRLRSKTRIETIKILKRHGVAVLLVTHDFEEAMLLGDKIALMQDGTIAQMGSPSDLYQRPNTPFVASFFGDVNTLTGVVKGGFVKTVIGDFSTKLADGTAVIIMIRPDDFDIISEADGNPGFPAHVSNSHNLGPLTHINLIPEGSKLVISARFLTKKAPKTGTKVLIRLDPSYAFVFPATLQT